MEFNNYPKSLVLYARHLDLEYTVIEAKYTKIITFKDFSDMTNYITVTDFEAFSSLIITIDVNDFTSDNLKISHIKTLSRVLQENNTLKYKSKLLIYAYFDPSYAEKKILKIQDDCQNTELKSENSTEVDDAMLNILPSRLEDYFIKVDNLIVCSVKCCLAGYDYANLGTDYVVSVLSKFCNSPIQKVTLCCLNDFNKYISVKYNFSTTTEGCFLWSINPALGIVFNHHKYKIIGTKDRIGSHLDTNRIKSYFKRKRMPLAFKEDANANEVKTIMKTIKNCNLSLFKTIVIFVMGHGDIDDIIYTNDGDHYSIEFDIVQPFLENEYLKDANLIVFVNACRGKYDPFWACMDDIAPNLKTDVKNVHPRVAILYSTQPGWISIRYKEAGSIFIQITFDYLDSLSEKIIVQEMVNRIQEPISKKSCCVDYSIEYVTCPETASNHVLDFKYCWSESIADSLNVVKFHLESNLINAVTKMQREKPEQILTFAELTKVYN